MLFRSIATTIQVEDAPPSYEEAILAVKLFVQENPEKAKQAIIKALEQEDGSLMVHQVEDFTSTINSLKDSFEAVSLSLIHIDPPKTQGEQRRPIWDAIYEVTFLAPLSSSESAFLCQALRHPIPGIQNSGQAIKGRGR